MPVTRTLSVLFTDIVGSTALFSALGESVTDQIRGAHFELIRSVAASYGGEVVKGTGDGQMLSFASATDAIRAAAQIQRAAETAARRAGPNPIRLRIGGSLGEVSMVGGDLYGPAVVEAARLCDQAGPGDVLLADALLMLSGDRSGLAFESVGSLDLKGLPGPRPASRLLWQPEEQSALRAILADDAVLVREGLARLLTERGVEVVAQAGDATNLVDLVHEHRPDVVITDVRMPPNHDIEGVEAAEAIRRAHPGIGVLLLSQHLETRFALRLVSDGAHGVGYLLKERVADLDEFVAAVRDIAGGGTVIDAGVIDGLAARARAAGSLDALSEAEVSLVRGAATGDVTAAALTLLERLVDGSVADDPARAALTYLASAAVVLP